MNDEPDNRVDDQLRSVGAEWRSRRPIRARLDPSLFAERRPRTLQAAFASVAGAVTLIVAVVVVVSLPPSDQGIGTASASPTATTDASVMPLVSDQPTPPATESAHPMSPPPTTATPAASPRPDGTPPTAAIAWQRFDAISADFEGGLNTVYPLDGRFLARAHRCPADRRECEHILLESTNGESWTVIASIRSRMVDALEVEYFHEDGLGFLASASIRYSGRGAGLWHSTDGTTWEEIGDQLTFERAACEPDGVDIHHFFRTGRELVALGRAHCTDDTGEPNLAWTSIDGRTWLPVESIPVSEVVADHGTFVGVQLVAKGTTWQSDDGLAWVKATEPGTLVSIGSVSTGFVAVGYPSGDGPVVLLTSVDGETWVERDGIPATEAVALASDGTRAVFIERFDDANVVWVSSPDGTEWSSYSMPAGTGQLFDGVAILANRLVVYGFSESAVWVGEIP